MPWTWDGDEPLIAWDGVARFRVFYPQRTYAPQPIIEQLGLDPRARYGLLHAEDQFGTRMTWVTKDLNWYDMLRDAGSTELTMDTDSFGRVICHAVMGWPGEAAFGSVP